MNELITITTGAQGAPVVSARELHGFLESKQQFSDWIKNRIIKYGFLEGTDYVEVDSVSKNLETSSDEVFHKTMKNSKGGRVATDYALTLDMAKELSMVERNDKGKQARQYFINAEKTLRALTDTPAPVMVQTPAQQLLQQAQLLVSHEDRISRLERSLSTLVEREQHRLEIAPPRTASLAVETTRQKVVQLVNQLAEQHGIEYYRAWNQLYTRLHTTYGFNVRSKAKSNFENLIDVCERYGQMDRLYAIVLAELNYSEE